ncbi:flavonol synthase/flavanone 3-hydroxylase [Eremomyces bilateralis CBS 781.70]|uniref:Flavonol synthase/flavanone 3-hydroxylase n=1 Tax=Eremomyces bilateralis CBS 781.70 TaxID=1392243 RepID=A0A6G1G6S9_9PEZI|nr:flavonol synthase/flavanone 3-hydroxylase [Eremomyces bilateralis CBS 781.70]KAF1813539.1 flavonol synthase/flavanone 3-hydroxylase [Eremomyces bilateralis CBS 781.70]
MSTVPIIDFGPFLTGSIGDRKRTASEVDEALRTIGCFNLRNHGIPQSQVDECFSWSRQLFSLSQHEKETLSPKPQSFEQGYFGMESERVRGRPSVKENFDFGNLKGKPLGPWPDQLQGFRGFATDFHQNCSRLMNQLLECMSIALGPKESLGPYHTGSMFTSSLIHYPAVSARLIQSGEVVRSPAHSDFGTLTLLFQRDVGGLQVADMSSTDKLSSAAVERTGTFLDVEPNPETILINVGYLLMRWTNGRWKNSVHKVVGPPSSRTSTETVGDQELIPERYSIAFFGFPDAETNVESFESCYSDQNPKRWSPLNAGTYLRKKREDVYS